MKNLFCALCIVATFAIASPKADAQCFAPSFGGVQFSRGIGGGYGVPTNAVFAQQLGYGQQLGFQQSFGSFAAVQPTFAFAQPVFSFNRGFNLNVGFRNRAVFAPRAVKTKTTQKIR